MLNGDNTITLLKNTFAPPLHTVNLAASHFAKQIYRPAPRVLAGDLLHRSRLLRSLEPRLCFPTLDTDHVLVVTYDCLGRVLSVQEEEAAHQTCPQMEAVEVMVA